MTFSRRSCLGLFFLCTLALLIPAAGARAAETDPAARVVEHFHTVLIDTMKARDADARKRRDALASVVPETFDFPRMARIIVGSIAWNQADEVSRQKLVHAFTDLNTAIYAAQFHDWSGQRFETVAVEPGPRSARLVHTRLVLPKDPPVNLTYVMTPSGNNGWRAADILIDRSISQLATRRAEYARILETDGMDGLSSRLEKQANTLIDGKP